MPAASVTTWASHPPVTVVGLRANSTWLFRLMASACAQRSPARYRFGGGTDVRVSNRAAYWERGHHNEQRCNRDRDEQLDQREARMRPAAHQHAPSLRTTQQPR